MYLLPQEIEVWYIIPAVRKLLSQALVQKHKMSYEKAGRILGVSKAAVSQYLSNKRANKIKVSSEIKKEIEQAAERIVQKENSVIDEIQKILRLMKDKKCSCDVCKKYNKDILKYCNCDRSW